MFMRERNGYLYEEHRWREGGKVRSKSVYRGKVGGRRGEVPVLSDDGWAEQRRKFEEAQDRGFDYAMRAAEQSKKEWEEKQAKERAESKPEMSAPGAPETEEESAPPASGAPEPSNDLGTGDL